MKTTIVLFIMTILVFTSCKKDRDNGPDNYAEITREHIHAKEASMSSNMIGVSNAGGIVWKEGDVYIFKNRNRVLGKFQVISIEPAVNYRLTIRATIYNADGSVAEQADALVVRGTFNCDLVILAETTIVANADFFWGRSTQTDTYFSPENGASFMKYNF